MRYFLSSLIFVLIASTGQSQIVINEIILGSTPAVELKNVGSTEADAGPLFLCSFPSYSQVQTLTVVSGSTLMAPGSILVITGHSFNSLDDELGLYLIPSYGDPANIIDYVEWGSSGHQRSSVAQAAGIWSADSFVAVGSGDGSLEYDGAGNMVSDWLYDTSNTQGAENSNIQSCSASAFVISTQNICPGESATFNVVLVGEAPWTFVYSYNGTNQEPVITSQSPHPLQLSEPGTYNLVSVQDVICSGMANGSMTVILNEVPTALLSGDGNVCGPGPGSLQIDLTGQAPWTLEYHIDGLPQGEIESSESPYIITASSEGFYNPVLVADNNCPGTVSGGIDVEFDLVEGGTISFENGSTEAITLCASDGIDDEVMVETLAPIGENMALLKVSDSGEILSISTNGVLVFNETSSQNLSIRHISYSTGITGLTVGENIADLNGCLALSNALMVVLDDDVNCTVSLDEIQILSSLNLVGNPISELIDLGFQKPLVGNAQLVIADIQGRIIMTEVLVKGLVGNYQINASHLRAGSYLLYVEMNGIKGAAKRFIKE